MRQRLLPQLSGFRAAIKLSFLLLAVLFFVVALARPRFGVYFEEVQQRGADLYILLDVSRSMGAQDVSPNRLEKAKADCLDLLKVLEGDRVGLIVFAGKPLVKVPLTVDQGFFREALREIDTQSAPRGGTQMGDAIRLALQSMPPKSDRDQAILLITDGEDHQSMPLAAAADAAENKVKIFTLAIGDVQQGARIPVGQGRNKTYLKDKDGREVWSKADEKLLEQIAAATHGAYIPAGTKTYDLGAVYEQQLSKLSRGQSDVQKRIKYREQFQWFLAFGVFALIGYVALTDCVPCSTGDGSGKRGEEKGENTRKGLGKGLEEGLGKEKLSEGQKSGRFFAQKTLVAFLGALACSGLAWTADAAAPTVVDKRDDEKQVEKLYDAGQYESAAKQLQAVYDRQKANPKSKPNDTQTYNLAKLWDKSGHFDKAIPLYEAVSGSKNEKLAIRAKFDLGCLYSQQANRMATGQPAQLPEETRKKLLESLSKAIQLWREIKKVQPDYPELDQHLETASGWALGYQKIWQEYDWRQQAQKQELLDYVQDWETQLLESRSQSRKIQNQPDGMTTRQKVYSAAARQAELSKKLDLLREKVAVTFAQADPKGASANGTAQNGNKQNGNKQNGNKQNGNKQNGTAQNGTNTNSAEISDQEAQRNAAAFEQTMNSWLDQAQESLGKAEDAYYRNKIDEAILAQNQAIALVDNIYLTVAPLQQLVERAIKFQKDNIAQTEKIEKAFSETKQVSLSSQQQIQDIMWNKILLARWSETIEPKATILQNQLPPAPESKSETPTTGSAILDKAQNLQDAFDAMQNSKSPTSNSPVTSGSPNEGAANANPQAVQLAAAHEMCKKAIELGPKIQPLVLKAGKAAMDSKFDKSLMDQKEALRLLEEILKNQQNQNDQNKNQQNPDPKNQDQQNQDQQKQDQEKQDQEKQDQEKQDQEKQDQEKQDQEKQDQEKQDQEKQDSDESKSAQDQEAQEQAAQDQEEKSGSEMTESQVRAMLRRVQARQEEKRKLEEKLRSILNPPEKVEKDW